MGTLLSWLWALGTALAFVVLGVLVNDDLDDQDDTGPAPAAPEPVPAGV